MSPMAFYESHGLLWVPWPFMSPNLFLWVPSNFWEINWKRGTSEIPIFFKNSFQICKNTFLVPENRYNKRIHITLIAGANQLYRTLFVVFLLFVCSNFRLSQFSFVEINFCYTVNFHFCSEMPALALSKKMLKTWLKMQQTLLMQRQYVWKRLEFANLKRHFWKRVSFH